jgi:hypothetical protein
MNTPNEYDRYIISKDNPIPPPIFVLQGEYKNGKSKIEPLLSSIFGKYYYKTDNLLD